MKETATSERHRFHQKHFITLLFSAAGIVIVAVVLVFMIRIQLITAGIVFGTFVVTYLLVNHWLKYFKELAGSLLYTGGVLLPAWTLHEQPLPQRQYLVAGIFLLIVLTNMLIFARFSVEEDQRNQQKSLATVMGAHSMNMLIRIVAIACFLLMTYTATTGISVELIILLAMEIVLVLVFEMKYFRSHDRYRIWGDAVFLLPAATLIVPPLRGATLLFLPSAG